jgi:hypothetical protein
MCVISLAPQATQIFQVLDVILFGLLRPHITYEFPFRDEKATIKFIIKVCHGLKQTMVEPNIWEAFQALRFELEFDTASERY